MSTPLHKAPGKPATTRKARSAEVYQLRIDLRGLKSPKVWRRIVVPVNIKLSLLHPVLLSTMGWRGGHLHEFMFAQGNYTRMDCDLDLHAHVQDESRVSLRQALQGSTTFTWLYDWGDSWYHKVKVERTADLVIPLEHPMCVTGQGACPPDDVGGVPGYEDFIEAMADPAHPEHDELLSWHGGPFDPAAFSVTDVQQRLDEVRL
jgi:hypothetical protein